MAHSERHVYMMPFLRTCPHCGAKIKLGWIPLVAVLAVFAFIHSAIEVGMFMSRRYGWDQDAAVISTILVFGIPYIFLLYFAWKNGRYRRRLGADTQRVSAHLAGPACVWLGSAMPS